MKTEISTTAQRLASMPTRLRHRYYRMKIIQHTPPVTAHDRFMLKIYLSLLDQPDDIKALEGVDQNNR